VLLESGKGEVEEILKEWGRRDEGLVGDGDGKREGQF
jgi:hypothetical protein